MANIVNLYSTPSTGNQVKNQMPGAGQMLVNAAQATQRLARGLVNGKKVFVSEEIRQERLRQCHACPRFKIQNSKGEGRCSLCGCYTALKLRLATESCPDNPPKWNSV